LPRDHGTLRHEEEIQILPPVTERLIVALPLGDDEIGILIKSAEVRRAFLQYRPGRIRAVVRQFCKFMQTGGMGVFTAAQRKGIPSEFLYLPDENHWVLKPQNSILWHDTVLDWLDRWTK